MQRTVKCNFRVYEQKKKLPPTQSACGPNGSFGIGAPARLAPSREERPARD